MRVPLLSGAGAAVGIGEMRRGGQQRAGEAAAGSRAGGRLGRKVETVLAVLPAEGMFEGCETQSIEHIYVCAYVYMHV